MLRIVDWQRRLLLSFALSYNVQCPKISVLVSKILVNHTLKQNRNLVLCVAFSSVICNYLLTWGRKKNSEEQTGQRDS